MDDFKRETVTMYAASTRRTRGLSGPWSVALPVVLLLAFMGDQKRRSNARKRATK